MSRGWGCSRNVERIDGCVGHLAGCCMAPWQRGEGLRGGAAPGVAPATGERRGWTSAATAAQTPAGPPEGWHGRRPSPGWGGRGAGDCGNVPDKGRAAFGDAVCVGTATGAVVGTLSWRCRWRGRSQRPHPLRQSRASETPRGAGERRGSISAGTALRTPVGPLSGRRGRRPWPGWGGRGGTQWRCLLPGRAGEGAGDRGIIPDKEMAHAGDAGCLSTATAAVVATIAWRCR